MDKRETVARALFAVDHPGRDFDRDIRADERDEWYAYADVAIKALEPREPPQQKAAEYVPPKPAPKPMFGKKK